MRRGVLTALAGLSIILLVPSSLAQSTVELGGSISMAEGDMGIEGISVSENQDLILAHGANSGIFLIDSNSPENNSHIEWSGDYSLLDSSFHPGGKTAWGLILDVWPLHPIKNDTPVHKCRLGKKCRALT